MYDHTINGLPYNNPKFHWSKIGLGGINSTGPNLKTLEELIKENKHENEDNMILKMDVENAEWEALRDVPEHILKKFKYIAIEYHFFHPEKEAELYYSVLKKMHKYHQPFYFRCNVRKLIV